MIEGVRSPERRIAKRDIAITGVLSVLGVLLMIDNVNSLNSGTRTEDQEAVVHVGSLLPYEFAIPLFLLVTLPLLWRRVDPVKASGASFCALLVNEALLGTEFLRCGIVGPAAFFFAFAAAAQLEMNDARKGLAFSLGLILVDFGTSFGPGMTAVVMGLCAAIWAIGRVVRSRKRMAEELEVRNTELRAARDERARLEVATDRAQLSGRLDELLQKRLGDLGRMAEEAARAGDGATATAVLADIENGSRQTLEEMRSLVGVLRHDDEGAPTAPQPTLLNLEALLVSARGGEARLRVEGNPRALPPGVELSAYRIVEQLLSSLGDTPDVEVGVRFGDDALELSVSGPSRRAVKAAVDRARERVELHQGDLRTSTDGGRAEAIASLPVFAPA